MDAGIESLEAVVAIIKCTVEKEVEVVKEECRGCGENKPAHWNQKGFLKWEQKEIYKGTVQRDWGVCGELHLPHFHERSTMP